mgnify:CR=1 FL=1|jgi:hypothetical protein
MHPASRWLESFAAARLLSFLLATVLLSGCAERPRIGIEIGTPTVKDCNLGTVTRRCD